jgi:two-component system nitrogen regulation response regulator GlnG
MAPSQIVEAKDLPPELLGDSAASASPNPGSGWRSDLERVARALLDAGTLEVWKTLTLQFEARLILTALDSTRGRRIEAAQKLGIGRKVQELGLDS